MTTGSVISRFDCIDCGASHDLELGEGPCRDCEGILDPIYDLDVLPVDRGTIASRSGSMWKYRELLPIRDADAIVSMGEGATPLIACPTVADRMGVDRLLLKDEGQNPTNTFKDRGQTIAISGAVERGAETVALPSAGNAGQSACAYAARAGIPCHVFVNHQAGEVQKGLVRAHGAELHLIDGKITEAGEAFHEAHAASDWVSISTFHTPFRHDGKKTMGYEIFEALDWSTPDEIVYPTGGGVGLIGIWKAYQELVELGWIDAEAPRLTVAQSKGAAPVVRAIDAGEPVHEPWANPESIARGVEIPDPGASRWLLEAVSATGGGGVAVSDQDAIDAALEMARSDGVEMCVTSAIALAGAIARADAGEYERDETVVVLNTGAGCKDGAAFGTYAAETSRAKH